MTKYTDEENRIWHDSLPKKVISAKAVLRSDKGNILIVKPNYRDHWQLPGGCLEAHEGPEQALVREIKEEVSINVAQDNLHILASVFSAKYDNINLIYTCDVVLDEAVKIVIQAEEIDDYMFVSPDQVATYTSASYHQFWAQYLPNMTPKNKKAG